MGFLWRSRRSWHLRCPALETRSFATGGFVKRRPKQTGLGGLSWATCSPPTFVPPEGGRVGGRVVKSSKDYGNVWECMGMYGKNKAINIINHPRLGMVYTTYKHGDDWVMVYYCFTHTSVHGCSLFFWGAHTNLDPYHTHASRWK